MPPFRLMKALRGSLDGLVSAANLNTRAHLLRLFLSTSGATQ